MKKLESCQVRKEVNKHVWFPRLLRDLSIKPVFSVCFQTIFHRMENFFFFLASVEMSADSARDWARISPENVMHCSLGLWDTNGLPRPDQKIITSTYLQKEENLLSCGFCRFSRPPNENKREWKIDKYSELSRELKKKTKKTEEHASDEDTICSWCTWNGPQNIKKRSRTIGDWRKKWNHSDYSIVAIGQNEMSPRDKGDSLSLRLLWKLTS